MHNPSAREISARSAHYPPKITRAHVPIRGKTRTHGEMRPAGRGPNCHRNPCKHYDMRAAPGCRLPLEFGILQSLWRMDVRPMSTFSFLQLFAHKYWIFAESDEVPVYDLRG